VVEADEYDRSFLTLHPDIAVITSVDPDHMDIYGDQKKMEESYSQFASQVKEGGVLIIKKGVDKVLVFEKSGKKLLTYSLQHAADYYGRKIEEGKPKMLILNNVRNKIILRIAAVIKSNRPYQIAA